MHQPATPPATGYVQLRGLTFGYGDLGRGPVVLDAHGLSSSRANNRRIALSDFSPVSAAGRRLISYDARGHGESAGSVAAEDYTWASLALDLLAFADHFSPDVPVSAIGTSMGTGTLIHAVLQRPDRFDRLVLTAPPTAWETRVEQVELYARLAAVVETGGLAALDRLMAIGPVPEIFQGIEGYPPPADVTPELLPIVFRGAALADLPPLDALASLTQPTLILAWAGDPGHPVSSAEKLLSVLPHAELHVSETRAELMTWGDRAATFLRP